MNETTILLSGDPKAKPEFLATVEPTIPRQLPFSLPFELVLDGYTREPWSSGKTNQNNGDQQQQNHEWQTGYLVSTDGRNRLSGFMQYLQGRKKAAVAKFEASDALPSSSTTPSGKAILVVPYDPPPIPSEELPDGVDKSQLMFVKYLRDENILKRDDPNAKKLQQQKMLQQQQKLMQEKQKQHQQQQIMQQKKQQSQKKIPSQPAPSSNRRGGLLGNLLGAQRRTENHLDMVRGSKSTNDEAFDPTTGAAGCINAFRDKISAEFEKFKSDSTTFTTKISISLGAMVKSVPIDEREKVTMDVFKFTVYEQVEEVGMDQWIAAKEPSEFMDECVINVYKEGHCPEDVLEDVNKGELPDEIKGQARHLVEAQSKAIQRKGKKKDEQMEKQANMGEDNGMVGLNTNKRDRRTLEQIQTDMQGENEDVKKSRFQ
mmetsp:Transcript_4035/g.9125  ORF Transcript_4035/g.9125 Transcript_4035/m.9125 type:complete len:430 (-) Transcript_4035:1145-2434(-)